MPARVYSGAGRKDGGLTLSDRLLHLAAFSAQRLSSWSLSRKLSALAGITCANIVAGAAVYKLATGDDWPSALFTIYGVLMRAPGFTVRGAPNAAGTLVLNIVLIYSVFIFAILLGAGIEEVKDRLAAVRSGEVGLRLQQHVLVLNWSPLAVPLLRQLAAARADPASPLHNRPVVLLADAPKAALDAQLSEALKGLKIELYVRGGQPWRLGDLERVCAPEAAVILLLEPSPPGAGPGGPPGAGAGGGDDTVLRSPEPALDRGTPPPGAQPPAVLGGGGSADEGGRWQQALKAAALMGVMTAVERARARPRHAPAAVAAAGGAAAPRRAGAPGAMWRLPLALSRMQARISAGGGGARGGGTGPRVIVQVPCVDGGDWSHLVQRAASLGGCDITIAESSLNQSNLLDRLVAQTALQPGLASVCREALRQGPSSAAFRYAPVDSTLASLAFSDAWALCRAAGAWLVGVVCCADGRLALNPSPRLRLCEGDELVALARGANILPGRSARHLLGQPRAPAAVPRALSRASTMSSDDLTRHKRATAAAAASTAPSGGGADGGGADGAGSATSERPPISIVVAGCGAARRAGLLEDFQRHAPAGSSVTFVHADASCCTASRHGWRDDSSDDSGSPSSSTAAAAVAAADLPPHEGQQQPALRVRELFAARPSSAEALVAAGVGGADALVLDSCGGCGGGGCAACYASLQAADAMLLCDLLALQEALEREGGGGGGGREGAGSTGGGGPPGDSVRGPGPASAWSKLRAAAGAGGRESSSGGGGGGGGGGGFRARPRRQLHVVCLVRSYGMRRTAQAFLQSMLRRSFSFELLIADELVSSALVQIATHPHNSQVFESLLLHRRGGTQLSMVPASAFGYGGGRLAAFGAAAEAVMKSGRLALGYRRADGRMLLAPSPEDAVDWVEGDELVVMADQDE